MKNVVKCAKNISECGGCEDGYEKRLSNNNMCYSVDPAATAEAYKETSDVAVMIDVLGKQFALYRLVTSFIRMSRMQLWKRVTIQCLSYQYKAFTMKNHLIYFLEFRRVTRS